MLKTLRSREQQKTTSLQSLKTSQDEVEMGLKRMKDEMNGWQRKKDLAVLRQWLRWWHFRARAISRGVRKTSEQRYFVERFRKSALATGAVEGMMSGMKIDSRSRRFDHQTHVQLEEEEQDDRESVVEGVMIPSLQDEEYASIMSRNERILLIDMITMIVNCFLEESRLRTFTGWTST